MSDVSQHVFANLSWTDVVMPHPVFEGDTICSRSTVLAARPSRSRPDIGIVTVHTEGYNQHGDLVVHFKRTVIVYRRGHGPIHAKPQIRRS